MKKIRVHVELYDRDDSTEYYDLPDNWDDMSEAEQEAELLDMAREALLNAAGSGAAVVDVDGNGREIEEGETDG